MVNINTSFTNKVKSEISRIELSDNCCKLWELSSILRLSCKFTKNDKGYYSFTLSTENPDLVRRVLHNFNKLYNIHLSCINKESIKLNKKTFYKLSINGNFATDLAIFDLGFLGEKNSLGEFVDSEELFGKECCIKSFFRGAFLSQGSMSNPNKRYHLDISSLNEREINRINRMLNDLGIYSNVIYRRNKYICYIKQSESIADFLNTIGAHRMLMEFENIRIEKSINNDINRRYNLVEANINKTVEASVKQRDNIDLILNNIDMETVDKELYNLMILRKENSELSLKDLGNLANPVLSKSSVSRRIKKIEELAETFKKNK